MSEVEYGYVYFMEAEGLDLVKIGYSRSNPAGRMREIRLFCPVELVGLGVIVATRVQEQMIHRAFADVRVRREWFRLSGPVAAYIREHAAPWPGGAWRGRRTIGMEENFHRLDRWSDELFAFAARHGLSIEEESRFDPAKAVV